MAQEPTPRDTARADTLAIPLPDSVRVVFGDTLEAQRDPPGFPARLVPRRPPGPFVHECDRDCIQSSTALYLLELLTEIVPGFTPLRAGFFSGPHYALDGPYGPGFVRLFVDGREILPLESGAPDLRRVSLAYLDRVRVARDAAGLVIDVATRRQAEDRAYSRISAGTGEPGLQVLDGIFANGFGSSLTVEGAFELLDANPGGVENDAFDALGRLSFVPGSNRFGLQFEFRTESVERTAADTTDATRRQLLLRARAHVTDDVELEAYAATETFEPDASSVPEDPEEEPRELEAETLGLHLTARPGAAWLGLGARLARGDAYPSLSFELRGGVPAGAVRLEADGRIERWDAFTTSEARAALSWVDTLLVPIALRLDAGAGTRGVPRPVDGTADSVEFRAAGAAGEIGLGPFRLSGRVEIERVGRSLPFDAPFDSLLQAGTEPVEVRSWEAGFDGPILPWGAVIPGLAPIRLRGFWRRHDPGAVDALYLPEHVARAELGFHDTFFDDNLEIWLLGFVERRGVTRVAQSGEPEPVTLAAYSWPGGHFMFKIGDFRFFWRLTNPTSLSVGDLPGADFPRLVNAFGVRWEFFN
ncbi:MAG: hypothetical protein ACRELC_09325 [Gemmatimonadota bacterium]